MSRGGKGGVYGTDVGAVTMEQRGVCVCMCVLGGGGGCMCACVHVCAYLRAHMSACRTSLLRSVGLGRGQGREPDQGLGVLLRHLDTKGQDRPTPTHTSRSPSRVSLGSVAKGRGEVTRYVLTCTHK